MHDPSSIKNSIFLPKTDFPMKGQLISKEPQILDMWDSIDLYEKIRERSKGREKFILHFGPPYANGNIHIGHALISILKDAVTKQHQMLGYDAPLVIGWDCHGLPIEWKIEEECIKSGIKRESIPIADFTKKCREFAAKWTKIQKDSIKKFGVIFDYKNPYSTMDKKSEATICERFYEILKKGLVYRGKKPVLWSVVEKTALAEAEVEYQDKVSDAIFVKFPVIKTEEKLLEGTSAVIWTTTPWTIPGNRAIAYSPDFAYSIVKVGENKLIIARDLVQSFVIDAGIGDYEILEDISGSKLRGTICEHPLKDMGYTYDIPLVPGKHVTIDTGVGLVHTAPAHGLEDFLMAKEHGLDVTNVVNDDGTMIDVLPCFAGMHIFKVNSHVIEELRKSGNLIHSYQIVHSYPHSWRSKSPLIYRTTDQWFISIGKIRDKLLQAIDNVEWFPSGYVNRIKSMVENRPDWCISRQRLWGVPIALFINKNTGQILLDDIVFNNVLNGIENEGLEAWHNHDIAYFLNGTQHNPNDYYKVSDTLEVWFDSACSHHYVLEQRGDMQWPANLYFEGSDQHRGWFQSALVESVCTKGAAPYRQVATNGFVLDKDGKKMSKSTGNVVSPDDITDKYGADILRLWCLNSDYSEDLRIGDEIIKHQMDVYRRLRNTIRYLLGVISGYKPESVEYNDITELEKMVLHKLYSLNALMMECIKNYEFQKFYTAVHTFCSSDLSSFYFDIRKDSVYCDGADDIKRRSCIHVMNEVFKRLVHWLAPALSFTTEEAWQCYHLKDCESIHLSRFPEVPEVWNNEKIHDKWERIRDIRRSITSAIEIERNTKTIGSSLEAEILVYSTNAEVTKLLLSVDLAEIAIVSKARVVSAEPPSKARFTDGVPHVGVVAMKSKSARCDRCWKFSECTNTQNLCARCEGVLTNIEN